MSTDIYLYAEVWDRSQKRWHLALSPRRHEETCFGFVTGKWWWEPRPSYSDTNRSLLTVLVDAPDNSVRGVAPARGLPPDLSPELAAHAARKDEFAHSHSHLLVSELIGFPWWQPALTLYGEVPPADAPFFGDGKRLLALEQIRAQFPSFPGYRELPLEDSPPGQVPVQWLCPYACFARADFMEKCLPELMAFGPPNHVRAVFWAG